MTKTEANHILDAVRDCLPMPQCWITHALIVTGDLEFPREQSEESKGDE